MNTLLACIKEIIFEGNLALVVLDSPIGELSALIIYTQERWKKGQKVKVLFKQTELLVFAPFEFGDCESGDFKSKDSRFLSEDKNPKTLESTTLARVCSTQNCFLQKIESIQKDSILSLVRFASQDSSASLDSSANSHISALIATKDLERLESLGLKEGEKCVWCVNPTHILLERL
ncbi:hypothetical protein CQA49_08725 [Helicobacter sp. MIT 00-7814]|uniref:hypothetical protein n=1 Tax=unclassified Helicobacter TaxID=2593540 RepID=UPI000E1F712C|nr:MULTISPECIES: hypothetical protein [unclassified Helicobacter]RDU52133.1 hypothetical protein CQA49_08725 [Helicobacter sp. MIT 00-7814]RDU56780.1 hypothetical protein CQA37_01370 [Helicobacter sp. MIT 99-10781]